MIGCCCFCSEPVKYHTMVTINYQGSFNAKLPAKVSGGLGLAERIKWYKVTNEHVYCSEDDFDPSYVRYFNSYGDMSFSGGGFGLVRVKEAGLPTSEVFCSVPMIEWFAGYEWRDEYGEVIGIGYKEEVHNDVAPVEALSAANLSVVQSYFEGSGAIAEVTPLDVVNYGSGSHSYSVVFYFED